MFGHQDDSQPQSTAFNQQTIASPSQPAPAPAVDPFNAAVPQNEPLLEAQATDGYVANPGTPSSAPALADPVVDASQPAAISAPVPVVGPNELLDIKQQALEQLSPLVGHLDQSPEEKFRTTMMMIQASDNQDLIQTAYEIAGQISDEKTRAQALLDIVNEINYFTQHNAAA